MSKFTKGHKLAKGRPKGVPNKATAEAKAAIEEAFRLMGDVAGLVEWAKENKTDFYKSVWPKILPLQLTGDADHPLELKVNIKYPSLK